MAERRYYEKLLIVAGMFFIFLVITLISLPLVMRLFGIDTSAREGWLLMSVYQAVVLFILPSFVAARLISPRPLRYLQLNRVPSGLAILGVIFGYLIALPALNQIIFWNQNISFPDSLAVWGETLREMEDRATTATSTMLQTASWGGLIVNLAVIGLVTAFAEEIFFRGTLQHTAASKGLNHTAIWVVAFLFSAFHFQFFGFVPRLILGAWFGYLLFWTRSLYVPVFAHFLNNGVVVVCSWFAARGSTIDFEKFGVVEYGFPMPAFVSALATVVFLIFFKRFFFNSKGKHSYSYA